jgi:transposase InsO family protein
VLDLATRKVVGWAMRDHLRAELTSAALLMAAQRQHPAKGLGRVAKASVGLSFAKPGRS